MKHLVIWLLLSLIFLQLSIHPVFATGSVLGIHILNPSELDAADQLLEASGDSWHYVTIPLSLNDLDKHDEWQAFFNNARSKKVIPVVRLVTKFENGAWQVPTKRDIVRLVAFLSALEWPTEDRHIIAFNEVNHTKEWGNRIDPAEYVEILTFTSDWAHTEGKNYKVMPAAMDLAAPNGSSTKEAFAYLQEMFNVNPDWVTKVDFWNSHSYPNPAFSASARATGKMSLRGYQAELAFIEQRAHINLKTFITETGWVDTRQTRQKLADNYQYAVEKVWTADDRVIAVTPFVLQGAPGPFSQFSFLDGDGKPTLQYKVYQQAMRRVEANTRVEN